MTYDINEGLDTIENEVEETRIRANKIIESLDYIDDVLKETDKLRDKVVNGIYDAVSALEDLEGEDADVLLDEVAGIASDLRKLIKELE